MNQKVIGGRLAAVAEMAGGMRTREFDQFQDFFESRGADFLDRMFGKKHLFAYEKDNEGKPMLGICYTLSVYWIAYHATQDRSSGSMWDHLFRDGKIGALARRAVIDQKDTSIHYITWTIQYLSKRNIIPRTKSMSGNLLPVHERKLTLSSLHEAATDVTQFGGYMMMNLFTDGGQGHSIVIYYDQSDVVVMDPNYGEFWLPSRNAFLGWFQYYLPLTYGHMFTRFDVEYYVKPL